MPEVQVGLLAREAGTTEAKGPTQMTAIVKRKQKKKYDKTPSWLDPSRAESYLAVLSDEKTRRMLEKGIFVKPKDFGLTRKQYYSRLTWLKELGLMERTYKQLDGRFNLVYARTTLGEVMNNMVIIAEELARNAWRFKSYDSVNRAVNSDRKSRMTSEERQSLRDTLFADPKLRRVMNLVNEASHLNHDNNKNETNFDKKGGERKN